MTPVWIAITGLSLAVATLVITLITHLVVHAYKMGQRDQRITALEGRPHDNDCASQLAALNATLSMFKDESQRRLSAVEEGINTLRNGGIIHPTPTPARRRAAQ